LTTCVQSGVTPRLWVVAGVVMRDGAVGDECTVTITTAAATTTTIAAATAISVRVRRGTRAPRRLVISSSVIGCAHASTRSRTRTSSSGILTNLQCRAQRRQPALEMVLDRRDPDADELCDLSQVPAVRVDQDDGDALALGEPDERVGKAGLDPRQPIVTDGEHE